MKQSQQTIAVGLNLSGIPRYGESDSSANNPICRLGECNKFVMTATERLHCTLLFLPTDSPNLNLIERCLRETANKQPKGLSTLLPLKLPLFDPTAQIDNCKPLTAYPSVL